VIKIDKGVVFPQTLVEFVARYQSTWAFQQCHKN